MRPRGWRRFRNRRPRIRDPVWRIALLLISLAALVLVAVLAHRIADITRGRPVTAIHALPGPDARPAVSDPAFVDLAELLLDAPLRPGHHLEVVNDGATFRRMYDDLRAARRSVTIQAYYCRPGAVSAELERILAERARAGVPVLFLADGFGCRELLRHGLDTLRASGAEVVTMRPVRWYSLHRAQHRAHGRIVVIDGRIGYTGGFGFDDKWIGTADEPEWRETNVRFTGPAVRQLQAVFLTGWAEATGRLLVGEPFIPAEAPAQVDGARAGVLFSSPGLGTAAAERFLVLSIAGASRTLYITNSYFVPSRPLRWLLKDAARRGVDVRLLTAGERTDVPSTRFAGRAYYTELLDAGVRIYEYRPAMMHAKTLVADGIWATVGSMNFDNRSLRLSDEVNLLVHDAGFGAVMDSLFLADLALADEIAAEVFARRPWTARLRERVTRLVAPLL